MADQPAIERVGAIELQYGGGLVQLVADLRWAQSHRQHGRKRLVFPHLKAIGRFAALFGDNLRNLRLNGMGTEASLSAHEEESIQPLRWGVEYIVRFHLLTLALAESKGVDPDPIHRDHEPWARARAAHP